MKTYVISLRKRSDRRKQLSLPFDYEFLLQDRLTGVAGIGWSLANLGCMLGHRQAIELAKKQKLEEVLVLEDDARLVAEIPKEMPSPITFLGGDNQGTHIIGSHAVYYHSSTFQTILEQLPTLTQLQASEHPYMLDPYDVWLSKHGVGYVDVFKSFDEENGDIPHGGKHSTKQLTTI